MSAVAAIVAEYGSSLSDAQRGAYKYTDAGVHLAWKLADGSYVYCGDPRERDPALVAQVIDVGVGAIVEGSDAEVPLRWLDLPSLCNGGVEEAVKIYFEVVRSVNAEACRLWSES